MAKGGKMERNELIEFIIQERLSAYFKENMEHGREEVKQSDAFLALLKEKSPDLEKEFQKYLDWTAIYSGEGQRGIYNGRIQKKFSYRNYWPSKEKTMVVQGGAYYLTVRECDSGCSMVYHVTETRIWTAVYMPAALSRIIGRWCLYGRKAER